MRYLKQYEAFQASILNNIMAFLKDKNKTNLNKFLSDLKSISSIRDFKMSELTISDIKYLKFNNALNLIGDTKDVRYIKFWFSTEKGYLDFTGTSNEKKTIIGLPVEYLPQNMLDKLSKDKDIKGYLTKIDKNVELNNGDYILINLGDAFYHPNFEQLTIARIFKDSNNQYFAIQNVRNGGMPRTDLNWREYGQYSWNLGYNMEYTPIDFHVRKINISDEYDTLVYLDRPNDDDDVNKKFEWNLPIGPSLDLRPWDLYNDDFYDDEDGYYDEDDNWIPNNSDNYSTPIENISKNANFAIILDLKNVPTKTLSKTLSDRNELKKGAIAFLTNDKFKEMNIQRYFDKIFTKFGFEVDTKSSKSLNVLLDTIVCKDLFLVVSSKSRRVNSVGGIFNTLNRILTNGAQENDINNIKSRYLSSKSEYAKYDSEMKEYTGNKKIVYDIYRNIGKKLSKFILSIDTSDVDEIRGVLSVIQTLDSYQFSNYYLSSFSNPSDNDVELVRRFEKAANIILR